jgi:hypothetical protein
MEAIYYCLQKHEEDILSCHKFSCKGNPGSVAKEAKINNIKNKLLFPKKQICIAGISVKLLSLLSLLLVLSW